MPGEGFEPPKAYTGRFTVCSLWPLGHPGPAQSGLDKNSPAAILHFLGSVPVVSTGRRGYLLVLGAAVLLGTTGTAQALGPSTSNPVAVGAIRILVGGTALVLLAAAAGRLPRLRSWWSLPVFVAGLAMAGYQPLFFWGVQRSGVAIGTVVAIGSAPVMAGALGIVVLGEGLTRRWAAATLSAVSGVVLLVLAGSSTGIRAGGLALSLGAGACYAAYAVATKRIVQSHPPLTTTALVFAWASVLSLPLLATADLAWLTEAGGIALALYLGIVTIGVAYLLFTRGLRVTPVGTAATLTMAEPATAALLGVVLLGEHLSALQLAGLTTIGMGLVLLRGGSVSRSPTRLPRQL